MDNSSCKLVGHWDIVVHDKDGNVKFTDSGKNVVTTNGKEQLAAYLTSAAASATANPFIYIAIGTGATTESAADTGMAVELTRKTGTASYVSNAIYQVTTTFTSQTGAVIEYGLWNASAAGVLFSRSVRAAAVNITDSDTLTAKTRVTLS